MHRTFCTRIGRCALPVLQRAYPPPQKQKEIRAQVPTHTQPRPGGQWRPLAAGRNSLILFLLHLLYFVPMPPLHTATQVGRWESRELKGSGEGEAHQSGARSDQASHACLGPERGGNVRRAERACAWPRTRLGSLGPDASRIHGHRASLGEAGNNSRETLLARVQMDRDESGPRGGRLGVFMHEQTPKHPTPASTS